MSSKNFPPPPVAVAARSAFRAGSLCSILLRPSRHAASGLVLVCSFSSAGRAGLFAVRWARRLGVSVVLRGSGGLWAVSVPVARSSFRLPPSVGQSLAVRGGVRGLRPLLASSGLGVF